MNLLQNPEIRRPAQLYFTFAVLVTALGFLLSLSLIHIFHPSP